MDIHGYDLLELMDVSPEATEAAQLRIWMDFPGYLFPTTVDTPVLPPCHCLISGLTMAYVDKQTLDYHGAPARVGFCSLCSWISVCFDHLLRLGITWSAFTQQYTLMDGTCYHGVLRKFAPHHNRHHSSI